MGTSLNGLTPSATYTGLLKFGDNTAISASLKAISDGAGNDTILELSTTALQIGGSTGAFWDDTNKRLGIGTNVPSYSVDVTKATSGTASLNIGSTFANANSILRISDGNARNSTLQRRGDLATGQLRILMNGSTKFMFTDDGKFGITQANPPTAQFEIIGEGTTSATTSLLVKNSASTNLLSVLDNGNVGIGTNTPTEKITAQTSTAADGISLRDASNSLALIGKWFDSSGFLDLALNGTPYTRIQASQSYINTPITFGSVSALSAIVGIKGSGTTSATTSLLVQNSAGTEVLRVQDDGTITAPVTSIALGNSNSTVKLVAGFNNGFTQNRLSFYQAATNIRGMNAGGQGLIISKTTGLTDLYPTALLAIDSTNQGFLPPRMTTAQKNAIATPAAGLMVYDTDLNQMSYYNGTTWVNI